MILGLLRGFTLSVPAGLLIYFGLASGESTGLALFVIVFLLGLPWNIAALAGLLFWSVSLMKIANYCGFAGSLPLNGWYALMWIVIGSGMFGAHINGLLLLRLAERDIRPEGHVSDENAGDLRLQIESTADVSLARLKAAAAPLPPEWNAWVDEAQTMYRSTEAPSWVLVQASAAWWARTLGGSAAAFLTGKVDRADTSVGDARTMVATDVSDVPEALRRFSDFLLDTLSAGHEGTDVFLALHLPDIISTARLKLSHADRRNRALPVALFVHHIPALLTMCRNEKWPAALPERGIQLELTDQRALIVSWRDKVSDRYERVIPFCNPATAG
ncbi:hypothetical protein [Methyloversatilis sp.]|uniref:hypothetical protein n=1 Tax=Methyloversatilis sp. TaxID=2569862 RepID=UPI0035B4E68A